MKEKVYAPNVHLFAFHLRNGLDSNYDSELLWKKCQEIFPKFHISQELKIWEVEEGSRIDLLQGATDDNILLPLEGKISLNN
ncbi:MAG: hypothetical protein AB4426_12895 [Xenococcaceae cyanobacterium]